MTKRTLTSHPVHLGLGARVVPLPEFPRDGRAMQWYADYGAQHAADGKEARLVAIYSFTEDWPGWEMHPAGDELVVCLRGSITLIQELDGDTVQTKLGPGEYAINPPGVWHTADVAEEAEALFITAGMGTEHRPR